MSVYGPREQHFIDTNTRPRLARVYKQTPALAISCIPLLIMLVLAFTVTFPVFAWQVVAVGAGIAFAAAYNSVAFEKRNAFWREEAMYWNERVYLARMDEFEQVMWGDLV